MKLFKIAIALKTLFLEPQKSAGFFAAIFIIMLVSGCSGQITGEITQEEPIKIGAVLPLTGAAAYHGQFDKEGILLALDELKGLTVIFEDDKGNQKEAASAARKLVEYDQVTAIFTTQSSPSGAIAPIAEENKVILIYQGSINRPAEQNRYSFKDFFNMEEDCLMLAQNFENIALLMPLMDSGLMCKKGVERNKKPLAYETFENLQETDFRTQLLKISAKNPDLLLIYAVPQQLENILTQMKELNINLPIAFPALAVTAGKKELTDKFPEILEGSLGTATYFDLKSENPKFNEFLQKYRKRFNKDPEPAAAYAYDDIMMLAKAIEKCKKDTECIRKELLEIKHEGVLGELKFNKDGISIRQSRILTFNDGGWN